MENQASYSPEGNSLNELQESVCRSDSTLSSEDNDDLDEHINEQPRTNQIYSHYDPNSPKVFTNKKRNWKVSNSPEFLGNASVKNGNNHDVYQNHTDLSKKSFSAYMQGSGSYELKKQHNFSTFSNQFGCGVCGKIFIDDEKRIAHEKSHHEEKPYKCEQCDKCFTQRAGLIQHKRLHSGEKPFKCQECGKGFAQLSGVVQHARTHSGEKPYTCSDCGKAFTQKAGLLQHERLHTGEKPFSCLECGKCFTQAAGLNQHVRVHSGEKPYTCNICGKSYSQHAGMIAHMKTHESSTEQNLQFSENLECYVNSENSNTSSQPNQEVFASYSVSEQSYINEGPSKLTVRSTSPKRPRMEKSFRCQICSKAYTQFSGLVIHQATHQPEQSSLSSSINVAVENILTSSLDSIYNSQK